MDRVGGSDGDETAAWLAGDPAAFATLFERHSGALFNYALRHSVGAAAAEDLVQGAFLEAWRRGDSIELVDESLRPWLFGTIRRMIYRHWRNLERGTRATARLEALRDDRSEEPDEIVLQQFEVDAQASRAKEALGTVPPAFREPLLLWAWDEMTYEQIAVVLDIPVGTVKSRIARARRHLNLTDAAPTTAAD
jgi:RNA polymerase sigma-70 factor (ECF subfamily)